MDTDGSGNINIKELIDFLEAVGGGDIDKKIVENTKCRKNIFLKGYFYRSQTYSIVWTIVVTD